MTAPRAGRAQWLGLAVLALPALLLALDLSVLNVALPRLSQDLGANHVEQLWISDVYGFLVAGFLVTMGRLGDRVGRRRLLLIGAAAFAAASVLAAFSTTVPMLVAARALMGVAGATLAPSTLALISTMFPDPRQRGTAVAVYVSAFMGGAALGPVVGGVLLQWFWWGSVFLLGVPVMALLLAAGPVLLPEFRDDDAGPLDLPSVLLSLAALLPLVHGVKELARSGVRPVALLSLAAGLTAALLFVRRQRRLADPLLDLGLFADRAFSAALVVVLVSVATQSGVMLLVGLDLQLVEGLSPLATGLWGVPPALAMVAGSLSAPRLAHRLRAGRVIAAGAATAGAGHLVLTQVRGTDGLVLLVAGTVVVFFGVGLIGALGNDLVVGSVEPAKAGSAAALVQTSGDLGIALGVAVLGSVGNAVYGDRLADAVPAGVPAGSAEAARTGITEAVLVAAELPGPQADALLRAARTAFAAGLSTAAAVGAALMLALALLAARALRPDPAAAAPAAGGPAPGPTVDGPTREPMAGGPTAEPAADAAAVREP